VTDRPTNIPTNHLSGSSIDPEGPRCLLSQDMRATDHTFYTTVEPGLLFDQPYRLVIDLGLGHEEKITARAVHIIGDEIEWEVIERGD
jgi:hypothetical protein